MTKPNAIFLASLNPALRADDVPALAALLAAGPIPELPSSLVALATSAKASRCVALLLERGFPAAAAGVDGLCALHFVRDAKAVRVLVAAGVPVDAPSPAGTPLHLAAANEGPPVIKALLELGADPNAQNAKGMTPLALACSLGRTAAVKALLLKPPAPATCFNLLAEYAQRGLQNKDLAVLATLLGHLSADLEPTPGDDRALHFAARSGSPEAVACLLKAGAAVDPTDRTGRTPAFIALETAFAGLHPRPRHLETFRLLVAAGANLDHRCGETTPRQLARTHNVAI